MTASGVRTFRAEADHDGLRLDHFLASVVPDISRSQLQRLIRDGRVRAEGLHVKPGAIVHEGLVVDIDVPAPAPSSVAAEAIPLTVLHDDEDLVVVDKPAGMVVHPGAGHREGTLVNALLHHVGDLSGIGGEERPGIVHRLDRGTSGLMVVAKNDAAHRELSRQFQDRDVQKTYLALVWGLVQAGRRIDLPIGRDPKERQKMSTRARRGREAATRIVRAEPLGGVTLVEVAIDTGRTHQIRVHLSAIGHPVVGDATYGGVRRHVAADVRAVTRLGRPFLHAHTLAFAHPSDGRPMVFESPLPADLQSVLDRLTEAQHT
ncbi:MAG TPA: RluA family pseudouridine synthase [Vicinamibacterales bacterium]|nr:RluA family pseudouridine synthase [Vicinamibacterales bacterium]